VGATTIGADRVAADKLEAYDRGRKGLSLGLHCVTVFPRAMVEWSDGADRNSASSTLPWPAAGR
jgi:hypothetical protein